MNTPLIEYKSITVCRGEKVALDSITLSIEVGEHVAILGSNGCGKSTLIWLWRDYDPSKTDQTYQMEASEKAKPLFRIKALNRD